MTKAEAQKIARALQRKGFPASSLDSGSNFGYAILNYETNAMYFNPWSMPEPWLVVYRKAFAKEIAAAAEA